MMKFKKNLSESQIKLIYILFAIIVFIITTYNAINLVFLNAYGNDQCIWVDIPDTQKVVITQIVKNGVTDKAGIQEGDTLIAINGKHFLNGIDAMSIINRVKYGDYAKYLIKRGDTLLEKEVKIIKAIDINYIAKYILGLGFLIMGLFVVLTKPNGTIQKKFANYAILTLLFFGTSDLRFDYTITHKWLILFYQYIYFFARITIPPIFLTFFFYFPIKLKIADKKNLIRAIYIFNFLLVIIFFIASKNRIIFLIETIIWIHLLFYISGHLIFIYSYFKKVRKEKQRQLRPILIGIVIGAIAFIYTFIISTDKYILFLQPFKMLPTILIIAVPISFGYSIFKYRLMDFSFIIKKSLVYGIVTTTFAVIYIVFVLGVGTFINDLLDTNDNQFISILAFIVIAFAFDPLKKEVQTWVDRYFYQDRYNYQKVLLEFSNELPGKINLTQIMESIVTRISSTMHIDRVAVTLWNKFECVCYSKNIDNSLCKFSNSSDGIYSFFKKNKKPQIFDYLSEEFEQLNINKNDKQKIIDANIILIVPMFFKDNLVGIISVGEKLSGKIYSQEDIDLLITVANQAAIAIENARLYESEFEKKKIQQELNLARKIQQGLLPQKMPFFNGVEISAISQPAELVGGDYYDLIQVDDNKLFVIVADVSGKGISAALYMSKIQGIMQLATRMYSNPKDILIEVNKQIYEGIERKSFVTMIVALFDFQEKTVTICRAGHNKPIVSIDNDVKLLDSTGIGLGLEKGNIFNTNLKESKLELGKDNLFVFYSDGLTETMNDKYEEYGESNLLNFIKNNLSLSPEELKISLLEEIYSFRNLLEPHDDLTLVIIKYKQ